MSHKPITAILCIFLSACIGWRDGKKPAYILNGAVGTVGAVAIVSVAAGPSGDSPGGSSVLAVMGGGLIFLALMGTVITSALPSSKSSQTGQTTVPSSGPQTTPKPAPTTWPD